MKMIVNKESCFSKFFIRTYLLLVLSISVLKSNAQQTDTSYNSQAMQAATAMYTCFVDTDYVCFKNYMLPDLCTFVQEKMNMDFLEFLKLELNGMPGLSFGKQKTTRVVQSINTKTGYQKIIETLLEIIIDGKTTTSLSYSIAFSNEGTDWKFIRIPKSSKKNILSMFPSINKNLRFPENQNFTNKTIEQVEKNYKIKYKPE